MKTAISIPDATFDQVNKSAADLGMSRSEFLTRAAQRYLTELEASSVTAQIDDVLMRAGSDDSSSVAIAAGRRRLAAEDDW